MRFLLDFVNMFSPFVRVGIVGGDLARFEIAEEVQNLELELISSEQVSTGPENSSHFK